MASRRTHSLRLQSISLPVSRVVTECIDEGLIVGLEAAEGDRSGLFVGLLRELRGAHIRHPHLNGSEALGSQSFAVRSDPLGTRG